MLEVMVAMLLMTSGLLGAAAVLHQLTLALAVSHQAGVASSAAHSKVAQWRALTWEYQVSGPAGLLGLADTSTHLGVEPPAAGGAGIAPGGGLDHVDARGNWAGESTAHPGAAFVRRWEVRPLLGDPDVLLLSVTVEPHRWSMGRVGPASSVPLRLVTVRVRGVR